MHALMVLVVVLLVLLPALLLLVRRHRQQMQGDELSPISRQHIDLFQGGQLSEAAVESAKARFRDLLERGEVDAVENSLRAGVQYVVQVRALAELGTEDAGRILERQLQRRLTDDQIEQAWYWIDLASGLRTLNRPQSLPYLLRTVDQAADIPLGHFLAAETVCFLGFSGYLRQSNSPLGRSATRVLLRALEGLRYGLPAQIVTEGRLGELVETLWDARNEDVDPLACRVYHEALRFLRRAPHLSSSLLGEASDQETFEWQVSRLAALEGSFIDYLNEAGGELAKLLPHSATDRQKEQLQALLDLRADGGEETLAIATTPGHPNADLALEVLAWSTNPQVGPILRDQALQRVPLVSRAQRRLRGSAPRRPSVSIDLPYRAILRALRGHAAPQTEALLLLAAKDWDPTYRAAAISSLGWWEPIQKNDVQQTLREARRDPNAEVRQAARAALARLGERQALLWFRQTLTSEDSQKVYEAIQAIASEGLTLLWPDLDRLADAENSEVAHHAREALERMGEELERGWK
ncbi:MAG: HEAT repeat domain-containing protein [Gemmataceae bacterium]